MRVARCRAWPTDYGPIDPRQSSRHQCKAGGFFRNSIILAIRRLSALTSMDLAHFGPTGWEFACPVQSFSRDCCDCCDCFAAATDELRTSVLIARLNAFLLFLSTTSSSSSSSIYSSSSSAKKLPFGTAIPDYIIFFIWLSPFSWKKNTFAFWLHSIRSNRITLGYCQWFSVGFFPFVSRLSGRLLES